MAASPSVLVFDVNETLVDSSHLDVLFQRLFGEPDVRRYWYSQCILYSQSLTLGGRYVPFSELAAATLRMLGMEKGASIQDSDTEELRERLRNLPAFPDAAPALHQLKEAGFRLATLTNSAPDPKGGALQRSGLAPCFEKNLSVHDVKRFKPAPETYRFAAGEMKVSPSEICLISVHSWDTIGAQCAGCQAALVTRSHAEFPAETAPRPSLIEPDLGSLAAEMIRRWR